MPERKMRQGALIVRTRQIPGYAYVQIETNFERPKLKQIGYKSAAGHTEYKDAPTDSPEWATYAAEVREAEQKISRARTDFLYDYSVESWSWDDGQTWLTEAPDGWVLPNVFKRHNLHPSENVRVDYIRYELITSNVDIEILFRDALENTEPITNAEVGAAAAGFRPEIQRGQIARASKPKWYHRFQRSLQRNERGA
jgi:hypothetical protein